MEKTISLTQLSDYLNTYLDPNKIQENAYNGIQVANNQPIGKIATAVSTNLETIQKAAQLGAQALIVHHGVLLKKDPHPITGRLYDKIKLLMDHNIALLCYHLPLDAHPEIGNNFKAAKDLSLQNLKPFGEYCNTLVGVIGNVRQESFEEFKKRVENYYGRQANAVKVKDPIKSVAIISGGADGYVSAAAQAGADCFITGRHDEKVWDDAHEENISFLGLGHYGTETVGPKALAEHLEKKFGIPSTFIQTNNPF